MSALVARIGRNSDIAGAYLAALVLLLIAVAASPSFLETSNLRSVATQASFVGIVALGQTFVILVGGVDLSIPWVMSASALLLATLAGQDSSALVWAVPVAVAFGASIGLLNGVGVAVFGISPIIMTLAANIILSGASSVINESLSAALPGAVRDLGGKPIGPVNADIAIWVVLAVLAIGVLSATTFGRRVYAVGTNARVARFSGIDVTATRIAAYVISGAAAACAGIMVAGYSGQAFAGLGDPYLFASVAAVAVGGASIYGGTGSYVGSIAGALVLTLLAALLPILELSPATLNIVYGVVILITVSLARIRHGPVR